MFRAYFYVFCGNWIFKFSRGQPNLKKKLFCVIRFVIPESPRWLLCKGRVSEVKAIIKAAAEFNGRELPPNMDKLLKPPTQEDSEEGCVKLFGTKYLRLITICFLCIWFTMNMVYYGMILNMNSFGGNVYMNTVSSTCVFFQMFYRRGDQSPKTVICRF